LCSDLGIDARADAADAAVDAAVDVTAEAQDVPVDAPVDQERTDAAGDSLVDAAAPSPDAEAETITSFLACDCSVGTPPGARYPRWETIGLIALLGLLCRRRRR
jgi:hypothetical protein